jgi:hypothetical protein
MAKRVTLLAATAAASCLVFVGCNEEATSPGGRDANDANATRGDSSTNGTTGGADGAAADAGAAGSAGDANSGAGGAGRGDGAGGAAGAGASGHGGGTGDAGEAAGEGGDTGGAVYPQPGQRSGPGLLPAMLAHAPTYLGRLAYDDEDIVRDLGYSGVVNGQIVWTFGDTLVANGSGGFSFVASDSAALGELSDPLRVHDKRLDANGWPVEWIPLNAAELAAGGLSQFAMGGTNVVEYAPNQGLVWFLKNQRGGGADDIVGAGVATVTADGNGALATRSHDTLWTADEPFWGDIGVTYNALDEHVYVFGHGPTSLGLKANVYLARVAATEATNVDAYAYWDQSTSAWTDQRFGNGANGTLAITSAQAIFTFASHGQSNAFWSNHYDTWMFVYGADWPNSDIYVSTAPELQGPWTNGVSIGTTCPTGSCGDLRYCIAPHPEFDPTGKTLLVTWTDANIIHAVQLEWQ